MKAFGSDYGEASVTVRFTCLIEQLVNLLAALASAAGTGFHEPNPGQRRHRIRTRRSRCG